MTRPITLPAGRRADLPSEAGTGTTRRVGTPEALRVVRRLASDAPEAAVVAASGAQG